MSVHLPMTMARGTTTERFKEYTHTLCDKEGRQRTIHNGEAVGGDWGQRQ